ncbi:MAG TPA: prolyl oligopeptidase family serine peptidase [Pirellulales bacterium]|jgi:polyhydroxybutyrate depolymerase|nr:prolyl oligopeptidase family serine peptidase [Pirellulales bacterium]
MPTLALLLLSLVAADEHLQPGNHDRSLTVADLKGTYAAHVPPKYEAKTPTPLVVVLHGAMTNGHMTELYTALDKKADAETFIAVYPDGTGYGSMLTWNCGGLGEWGKNKPNDVQFIGKMLDDLQQVLNVDKKRVFATGISNGGMMCYKLAAEMSDRIAAIAPVSGTMTFDKFMLKRPVSVMHFHGTDDRLVPFGGPKANTLQFFGFHSVEDTIARWAEADGCPKEAKIAHEPHQAGDPTKVTRKTFGPGRDGAEVVLLTIDQGGHTWPGAKLNVGLLGNTSHDISANDLMWEFFVKHPIK